MDLQFKMKFNFDIQKHIDKLLEYAKSRFPDGPLFIEVKYWDDNDFLIEVHHSCNNIKHVFYYMDSIEKYYYEKRKVLSCRSWNNLQEKELEI